MLQLAVFFTAATATAALFFLFLLDREKGVTVLPAVPHSDLQCLFMALPQLLLRQVVAYLHLFCGTAALIFLEREKGATVLHATVTCGVFLMALLLCVSLCRAGGRMRASFPQLPRDLGCPFMALQGRAAAMLLCRFTPTRAYQQPGACLPARCSTAVLCLLTSSCVCVSAV
ncbi:hypothetical protein NDU88_000075 [Pleurodeles waltl]|uniref:Uncharacterized protein n=1 Tax=Pleurodeles waltl TaxID=8319 RepID=A0AAV7UPH3_PLEWA|nr:hypothetical protein NDU88_000075 [Pleurodeles waltl]